MIESFFQRALENLKAAELLFENGLYNASANRAYYSAFHAAIVVLFRNGLKPDIDHRKVLSLFSSELINKRKIFSSKFKEDIYEMQKNRILADYGTGISKTKSATQLKFTKEFIKIILKDI
ncbi:MAG: hypothetical protein HW421_1777 [Ignavibacteria bacterium]|nr:hypothetical protein [Ignavibacteria bacterium]